MIRIFWHKNEFDRISRCQTIAYFFLCSRQFRTIENTKIALESLKMVFKWLEIWNLSLFWGPIYDSKRNLILSPLFQVFVSFSIVPYCLRTIGHISRSEYANGLKFCKERGFMVINIPWNFQVNSINTFLFLWGGRIDPPWTFKNSKHPGTGRFNPPPYYL